MELKHFGKDSQCETIVKLFCQNIKIIELNFFLSFFERMIEEPAIHGIPNASGFGCWFASVTQCLFRNSEIRNAILNFDPETLHLDLEATSASIDAVTTFNYLKEHFLALMQCEDTLNKRIKLTPEQEHQLSNTKLLESLRLKGKQIWEENKRVGADSRNGLEALIEMFSNFGYTSQFKFKQFSSPLKDFLFISDKLSPSSYIPVDQAFQEAILSNLSSFLYLPKYIVCWVQKYNINLSNPPREITLPEPIDYVLSDKKIENCSTKVHYRSYGYVLYCEETGGHAIALVNTKKSGWVRFDDISTHEENIETIKFTQNLWPTLIFYSKD